MREVRFKPGTTSRVTEARQTGMTCCVWLAPSIWAGCPPRLGARRVPWKARQSVRAKLRLMVKRILRKYKYPPDLQDAAVELVLQQAQALGVAWAV